jgi:hypothetical protein
MQRSLTRVIAALLLILIVTIIVYAYLTPRQPLLPDHSDNCDDNGYCEVTPNEDFSRPPSRQEFMFLEIQVKLLTDQLKNLKQNKPPKELVAEERIWEARRTECSESVVRNIDYIHVQPA